MNPHPKRQSRADVVGQEPAAIAADISTNTTRGMNMAYPTGLLHNTTTNRFHPISFQVAPPSCHEPFTEIGGRFRSVGHHTVGFDTRDEALAWIAAQGEKCSLLARTWAWDGEDVPARVEFFSWQELAAGAPFSRGAEIQS